MIDRGLPQVLLLLLQHVHNLLLIDLSQSQFLQYHLSLSLKLLLLLGELPSEGWDLERRLLRLGWLLLGLL